MLRHVFALAAGAATVLAFGPFNLYWVGVAGPAVLFYLWLGAPPRSAFFLGLAFGVGLFGFGVSWTFVSMHVYGNMPAPLAGLAVALFVLFLALFPAAAGLLQALSGAPRAARAALVMPACWTLSEWVRGWLLTGFPWLSLGYGQIDSPLSGLAPWLGVLGVSLFSAVCSGLVAALIAVGGARRRLLVVCAFALVWAAAWSAGRFAAVRTVGGPVDVAVVQGNVPLESKWHPDRQASILDTYLELSAGLTDRDLVVWPEAALPFYLDQLPASFWRTLDRHPADFVTGILERRRKGGGEESFNSVLAVADERALYRKAHLVPFGEYLPLPFLFGWIIENLEIPMSDFSAWKGVQDPVSVAGIRAGVSICYEDAFQDEVRRSLQDAALMINVSEDAWFGDSLAPHQRLDMARMRALENGRPVIRAGNSGVSAVIDHRGRVVARTRQFERAVLLAEVQPARGLNPFVRFGSWPAVILCALIAALSLPIRRGPVSGRPAAR